MEIHGFCDPAFEPVREAFAGNFERGLELGARAAVTVDGQPVVDLWAGDAGPPGRPWREDTIVNVYSTTKTMAALCLLMLADRREIDFDAPVARYWPESGRADVRRLRDEPHGCEPDGRHARRPRRDGRLQGNRGQKP